MKYSDFFPVPEGEDEVPNEKQADSAKVKKKKVHFAELSDNSEEDERYSSYKL